MGIGNRQNCESVRHAAPAGKREILLDISRTGNAHVLEEGRATIWPDGYFVFCRNGNVHGACVGIGRHLVCSVYVSPYAGVAIGNNHSGDRIVFGILDDAPKVGSGLDGTLAHIFPDGGRGRSGGFHLDDVAHRTDGGSVVHLWRRIGIASIVKSSAVHLHV